MIPISLTLQGIYSYQKRQTIDFTQLTEASLFGIFGPVGSGKSTVLEAISFALYGQTERLNQKDNLNYNMMNLKSDEFFIEFDFKAGKNHIDDYRCVVKTKRNSKNYENVGSFDRKCYKKENDEWTPLETKTAEDIIGLSYDNFRRTVIIPQGKFQEFIGLKDKDRTDMLKELFGLDKFDLYAKTAQLDSSNNYEIENIKGQLEQISEEANPDVITEKNEKLKQLESDLKIMNKKQQELTGKEKKLSELKSIFEGINKLSKELAELEENKKEFATREEELKIYESCLKNFKDIISQKKKLEADFQTYKESIKQKNESLLIKAKTLEETTIAFTKIKTDYDKKDELNTKSDDLSQIIELKDIDKHLKGLELLIKEQKQILDKKEEELKATTTYLKAKNEEYKTAKKDMPDWDSLNKVQLWFTEQNHLATTLKQEQKNTDEQQKIIDKLQKDKDTLLNNSLLEGFLSSKDKLLLTKEITPIIQKEIDKKEKEKTDLENKIRELSINEKMGDYVNQLTDGKPCPLCGSADHPHILKVEDVKVEITKVVLNKETIIKEIDVLYNIKNDLSILYENFKNVYIQKQKADDKIKLTKEDIEKHNIKFIWKQYRADNEEQIKGDISKANQFKEKADIYEKEIETLNTKLETETKQRDTRKASFEETQKDKTAQTAKHETTIKQLKVLKYEEYIDKNKSQCETEKIECQTKYSYLVKEHERLNKEINELNKVISELGGQLKTEETAKVSITAELIKNIEEINNRLIKTKIENLEDVEKILAKDIDIDEEQKRIKEYNETLIQTKAKLKNEQDKINDQKYDEANHNQLIEELVGLNKDITTKNQAQGAIKEVIAKLMKELETKKKLITKMDELIKRKENIGVLKRLFTASGFVNYISTKYLQNLCNAANDRFYKLTRQQLKIEITDNNTFQVRDYLHEGRVRSIKTLSGGQTFQAALSLALALADQVNQLAGAKQNFFFLDEGFGTLDKESLHTVFDTLKQLHKENRIVGVISHVEEMQQEIDVYLDIKNDEEQGSLVERSWE
ncbi:MAG: SMC family ATPase [Candidatus Margulisbacteria bacterium]|nr:SMC family ATPase [Candidatus Margulisiibacteriota bacterium]